MSDEGRGGLSDEARERGRENLRTLPHPTAVRFNVLTRRVEVDLHWGYTIQFAPERV